MTLASRVLASPALALIESIARRSGCRAALAGLLCMAACAGQPEPARVAPAPAAQPSTSFVRPAPAPAPRTVKPTPVAALAPSASQNETSDVAPILEGPSDAGATPVRYPFHESARAADAARGPAMRYANLAPGSCRRELNSRKLPMKWLGATSGVASALKLTGRLRGVRFLAPGGKTPYGKLDCRLALVVDDLSRILEQHDVVEVRVDNYYRPRAHLPGRRTRSQHAYGLAMDVTSFTLEDGRALVIERDWPPALGAPACGPEAVLQDATPEAVALRNLICELARAGVFHHILTPNFNAAHRNHVHMDIKRGDNATIVR